MQDVFEVREFTVEDIERRSQTFLTMWREILPLVEYEVAMPFDTFSKLV